MAIALKRAPDLITTSPKPPSPPTLHPDLYPSNCPTRSPIFFPEVREGRCASLQKGVPKWLERDPWGALSLPSLYSPRVYRGERGFERTPIAPSPTSNGQARLG